MAVGYDGQLDESAPALAQSVAPLRRTVIEFAAGFGASARQLEDIAVAVSEALTNAVVHGYAGRETPGGVEVQAAMVDGLLEIVVCDAGVGMRPRFASRATGVGLALIARMTDRARFEDAMPGVRVRMTFTIG